MTTSSAIISSPVGILGIYVSQGYLSRIDFLPSNTTLLTPCDKTTQTICDHLNNYFQQPINSDNLPLKPSGTPFQQAVFEKLRTIPIGQVLTYGQLAKQLKTSPRAIGNACRSNPIPILIPCHRIVAQSGLGGYAGNTAGTIFAIKTWLLQHEGHLSHSPSPS